MEITLETKNLSVSYDGKPVLREVSLSFPARQITSIIGPSGCGKTTLLKSLNRMLLLEPGASISGDIFFDGKNTAAIPQEDLRRQIGLVFQTPTPFPGSIYKNMTYAPRYYGVKDRGKLDALTESCLTQAGLYDEVRDDLQKDARKLSGGQQQRLCIARALTAEPTVLLLDEPCSALDVKSAQAVEDLLLSLKKMYTIIIVTHNIFQARRISDYTVFLYGGAVLETGETETFFASPKQQATKDFLSGAFG